MLFMKNEEKKMTKKEKVTVVAKVAASVTVIGGCVYFGSDFIKLKNTVNGMKSILLNSGTIDCAVQNLESKLEYYSKRVNELTELLNGGKCSIAVTKKQLAKHQAKYDEAFKCLTDTLKIKELADKA